MQASFAAGCFWGVEETFSKVPGILRTEVGYSGGYIPNPTYEEVCTGATGHQETVRVEYDPSKVSYEELLDVFWRCHDPSSRDRQKMDVGNQYRSVIFYYTDEQKEEAIASKARLTQSGRFKNPIVTDILPAKEFYRAEEYHQRHWEKKKL